MILPGQDVFKRRLQVDGFDFAARRHDVLDRDVFEVEQVQQHRLVLMWDEMTSFQHHSPQIFG